MTTGAFLILFLVISLFTSKMVKANKLIDLMKSEGKAKNRAKGIKSISISFRILHWIRVWMCVLFRTRKKLLCLTYLEVGSFVVIGTYFLFSQLSVYVIRVLKKKDTCVF